MKTSKLTSHSHHEFDRFLVATYTNRVKKYCDTQFFEQFVSFSCDKIVVDNSPDPDYAERLARWHVVHRVSVPPQPLKTRFLRNICTSVNYIRNYFLRGNWDYLLLLESDVRAPDNLLELFCQAMDRLEDWGAIGGIYYEGFHDFQRQGQDHIEETHHVLSGCTDLPGKNWSR